MWSTALKMLFADRGKLFTALVGVVFSVVLINIQGGLFLGLIGKASLLVDHGGADIWVGHRKMHNVDFASDIPRRWICRVRGVPGVRSAEPYTIGFSEMALPSGGFEAVVVVGVPQSSLQGNAWNIVEGRPESILQPDGVIVDRCEAEKLEDPHLGEVREIAGRRARVVAKSDGVLSFLVAPYVFTTHERASRYLGKSPENCSYFLVTLQPGVRPKEVAASIREVVPELEVLSRDEYSQVSVDFWMTRTGLGISFGLATLLGLLVGLAIVAQTLYAMVLDRLGEYGALKAIGASGRQLYAILFAQATFLAMCGSAAGLVTVAIAQRLLTTPRAPIVIPWSLSASGCILVMAVCLLSSLAPHLRLRKIDPVVVLQT